MDSNSGGDYEDEEPLRPGKRGRGASNASSQADYAQRHQAAEQRRRLRINERLDALRKVVPHDPRANTASFLEDVLKYILTQRDTIEKLEQLLLATHPATAAVVAAHAMANGNTNSPVPQPPTSLPPAIPQSNLRKSHSSAQLSPPSAQAPPQMMNIDQHNLQQFLAFQAASQLQPELAANITGEHHHMQASATVNGQPVILPQALVNMAMAAHGAPVPITDIAKQHSDRSPHTQQPQGRQQQAAQVNSLPTSHDNNILPVPQLNMAGVATGARPDIARMSANSAGLQALLSMVSQLGNDGVNLTPEALASVANLKAETAVSNK